MVQVELLCRCRSVETTHDLHLIVADAKYGHHRVLRVLKGEPGRILVRLSRNRVLYGEPGPYSGGIGLGSMATCAGYLTHPPGVLAENAYPWGCQPIRLLFDIAAALATW